MDDGVLKRWAIVERFRTQRSCPRDCLAAGRRNPTVSCPNRELVGLTAFDWGDPTIYVLKRMPNSNKMHAQQMWNKGLSAWIIQDGNYPDFAIGEVVEFAVEYYREPNAQIALVDAEPSARPLNDALYDGVAEKVLLTEDITVLNVGIFVYREAEQTDVLPEAKSRFETQLYLGVDPFFYFERLSKLHGIPPLIYSWRIS